MFRLGIDLGGTKIEGVVLDREGKILFRERIATEQEKGYEHILRRIHLLYGRMKEKIAGAPHALGIGTPGALSHKTGRLKNSNTAALNDRLCLKDLENILEHPAAVENDANCFAMAEAQAGAGKGKAFVFGVIMGTGCGGGLIYKGELLRGHQAIAGEWGHMVLDPQGPPCYCGARGCVETFISGGGLESLYRSRHGSQKPLKDILADYRNNKADARDFLREFFARFGQALANVINVLDPDIVVLGGGLSQIEELYGPGVEEVKARVFTDELLTPVVQNKLGDSAGVLGAAWIGI
ncbi:MAG TPA: ROK family protein [Verrucomicrobiae bacterium]|jgi:fructokinase|nr:ROK family protein [Verrucomicrobiae bacterium]